MAPLSLEAESTVSIAALTAAGQFDNLAETAAALRGRGAIPADLREAAFVVSLFCGFPKGVAALVAMASLDPLGAEPPFHLEPRARAPRRLGRDLFVEIHQGNAVRQLTMLKNIHPDFADTILREAYGRVLARGFLPLKHRELVGVAALVVLDLRPQLRAHLLGAHNTGATWAEIGAAIALAAALGGIDPAPALAMAGELEECGGG